MLAKLLDEIKNESLKRKILKTLGKFYGFKLFFLFLNISGSKELNVSQKP